MPYIVICQKQDGSIEVAAHPGEATAAELQGAQPAQSVDEAMQMAKDVLSDASGAPESASAESGESPGLESLEQGSGTDADDGNVGTQPPSFGKKAPPDLQGQPLASPDDQMAAGFKRAKKGY